MMELTRKTEYAIRGILYLATRPNGEISLISEIASAVDVPHTFLAKIFQQFTKIGLVKSYRGTGGGFLIGRPPEQITLLEVVEAVEGPIIPNRCLATGETCPLCETCNVHPVWMNVQLNVRNILAGVTIKELAKPK